MLVVDIRDLYLEQEGVGVKIVLAHHYVLPDFLPVVTEGVLSGSVEAVFLRHCKCTVLENGIPFLIGELGVDPIKELLKIEH